MALVPDIYVSAARWRPDHICTRYHLLIPGEVLGQRVEAAEDIQNQMIGLGGLVPLQQKRQSKLY